MAVMKFGVVLTPIGLAQPDAGELRDGVRVAGRPPPGRVHSDETLNGCGAAFG